MKLLALWLLGLAAATVLVLYDVHVLMDRPTDVIGNLEASVIWGTPAALLFLWRAEVRHRQRERAAQARHQEGLKYLDAIDAKVDQLHQHLGIEPEAD